VRRHLALREDEVGARQLDRAHDDGDCDDRPPDMELVVHGCYLVAASGPLAGSPEAGKRAACGYGIRSSPPPASPRTRRSPPTPAARRTAPRAPAPLAASARAPARAAPEGRGTPARRCGTRRAASRPSGSPALAPRG